MAGNGPGGHCSPRHGARMGCESTQETSVVTAYRGRGGHYPAGPTLASALIPVALAPGAGSARTGLVPFAAWSSSVELGLADIVCHVI